MENHAKYGDSIYFHAGEEALFVNLFIASELDWKARGVRLRQTTAFPSAETTRLAFTCAQPAAFALKLRWPAWATRGVSITVNGGAVPTSGQPGSWVVLPRTWKDGDVVEMTLPFALRTEGFADNPDRFAFLNGPVVLCAQVDPSKPFPAVVAERGAVVNALQPAGAPHRFTGSPQALRAPGMTVSYTLEPFYALHGDHPYQVYFDRFTPAQWKVREADYAADLARQRELAARTVDSVVPDREQSERDHAMHGERTGAGDFGDRKWRHATDGGWFSWTLKVLPDAPQELQVTYWGSDAGNRVFDVLVDGRKIATQQLEQNRPDQFFDESYRLPGELLAGKQSVTVKFQAHPGAWAGGVFGARIMRSDGAK